VSVEAYGGQRAEWDDFVRRTPGGTFFHLIGWKEVLERTFAFRSHYLLARRAGRLAGVLPLFEIGAPFMERRLLSLPFAVDGGVCSADGEAQRALEAAALELAEGRRAASVELRDGLEGPGFRMREGLYYRFRRPLEADDARNLAAIPKKRRYMIRLGQRHGLVSRTTADDLPAFHDLYARTARRFGTPVFPMRFFRAVLESCGEDAVLLTVLRDRLPVAGALLFFFGGTVCPYWVGSRREHFRYAVNDFLYWEAMRLGAERGARLFDFGRSKRGTGAYEFKRLWGFEPEPMRYRIHDRGPGAAPDRSTNDAGLARLQNVWRRLPLPLTKLIGPPLVARYGPYYT
jgi:FemAB-related protein (PEP-CTERM system-associated)